MKGSDGCPVFFVTPFPTFPPSGGKVLKVAALRGGQGSFQFATIFVVIVQLF